MSTTTAKPYTRHKPSKTPIVIHPKACAVCGLRSAGILCDNCRADMASTLGTLQTQHAAISDRVEHAYQALQEAITGATDDARARFAAMQDARLKSLPEFDKRYRATLATTTDVGDLARSERVWLDAQADLSAVEMKIQTVKMLIEERKRDEVVQDLDWDVIGIGIK